jgi:2-methylcitrate dehydratase PrpD
LCAAPRGARGRALCAIECDTAEGIVHRLWEPLASKQRPPNAYAAKFSVPYCIAYGLVHGAVGLEAFTGDTVHDPSVLALAAKVSYRIDPGNPYPGAFTGHLRVTLRDGRVLEERQPHFRGGQHEPLPAEEIAAKFRANCAYGGWSAEEAQRWLEFARRAFDAPTLDLGPFRG